MKKSSHPASKRNSGRSKKKNASSYFEEPTSDATFQFIAGYTEGGAPFGITWEKAELMEKQEALGVFTKNEEAKDDGTPVNLALLIDAFDMQSDDLSFFVNRTSGEIFTLTEIEEMEEDEMDQSGYIPLPPRWEINKYGIMEDFIFSLEDPEMQEVLTRAIMGKGAFGRFHTAIQAYRIQDEWYEYLKGQLQEMAVEWCNQNRLSYTTISG